MMTGEEWSGMCLLEFLFYLQGQLRLTLDRQFSGISYGVLFEKQRKTHGQ